MQNIDNGEYNKAQQNLSKMAFALFEYIEKKQKNENESIQYLSDNEKIDQELQKTYFKVLGK